MLIGPLPNVTASSGDLPAREHGYPSFCVSFGLHLSKMRPEDRLYCRCGAALFRADRFCLTFFDSFFIAWAACFAAFFSTSVIFIIYLIRFYLSPSIFSCMQLSMYLGSFPKTAMPIG